MYDFDLDRFCTVNPFVQIYASDEGVATTKAVGSDLLGAPLLDAYDRPRTVGVRVILAW